MKEHSLNQLDNFMGAWVIDSGICDELIDLYHKSPHKERGLLGIKQYRPEEKDSTDVRLQNHPDYLEKYFKHLYDASSEYVKKYPYSNHYSPWVITESVNIQHYKPGGGYKIWHTERCNAHYPYITRHLVFMTYLNDVTDCGETEFFHQKLKVKPEKGLTLVWPADWTFTHRGIVSPTQDKYIVTGWFNFVTTEQWEFIQKKISLG